jgi:hypothetical protein
LGPGLDMVKPADVPLGVFPKENGVRYGNEKHHVIELTLLLLARKEVCEMKRSRLAALFLLLQ